MRPSAPARPVRTERLARAAAGRALLRESVRRTGVALAAGAAVGLGLVGADKLAGGFAPWPLLVGAPAAAALAYAVGASLLRRWTPLRAAIEVDRSLGLKDRLSSAMALAEQRERGSDEDPFVALAVREAEEAAQAVHLDRVMPVRFGWSWAAWPVLGAAAVALAVWAPWVVWEEAVPAANRPIASRTQTAADLAEVAEAARAAVESSVGDIATPEQLRTLDELHAQLMSGDKDPDSARIEASRHIENLASELARAADRERMEQDRLREELAALAEAEESEGPAAELARALREGDLQAGRRAVQELMNAADTLSPEERERIASDMERLAEAARPSAPDDGPAEQPPSGSEQQAQPGDAASRARQELEQQGLAPEQAERISQQSDPKQIEQELRDAGVEPEPAQRMAERIARENVRREAEESARRQVEEMREAMREAAEELREPPRPPAGRDRQEPQTPNDQQRNGEQPPDQGQEQQQPGERPNAAPDGQQQQQAPGAEQRPQQQQQNGERQGRNQQPGQQPSSQRDAEQRPAQQPGSQQNQPGQQQPAPGDQQPGRDDSSQQPGRDGQRPDESQQPGNERPGQRPEARPGEQPSQGQRGQRGESRPGDQQNRQAEPQPGQPGGEQQSADDGSQGQGQGRGLQRLGRHLDRLAREAQNAEQDAEKAERLREAARQLLEESTPEEREQLRRWAEQLRQEQQGGRPLPTSMPWRETDTVDARPAAEPSGRQEERVVAQWFSDEPAPRGEPGRAPAGEQVLRAAQSAERAVESQPISNRRRDFVKRVFRRYAERAEETAPNLGPPRR